MKTEVGFLYLLARVRALPFFPSPLLSFANIILSFFSLSAAYATLYTHVFPRDASIRFAKPFSDFSLSLSLARWGRRDSAFIISQNFLSTSVFLVSLLSPRIIIIVISQSNIFVVRKQSRHFCAVCACVSARIVFFALSCCTKHILRYNQNTWRFLIIT